MNVNDDSGGLPDLSYLEDRRASWAAKGFYTWLLTQPQGTPVGAALAISSSEEELTFALEELSRLGIMQFDNPLHAMGGKSNTGIQA